MGCMSLVYVFAAMKMESQAVERLIGLKPDSASRAAVKAGKCGSNEVVLFTTGMGPRRDRATAASAFGAAPGLGRETTLPRGSSASGYSLTLSASYRSLETSEMYLSKISATVRSWTLQVQAQLFLLTSTGSLF